MSIISPPGATVAMNGRVQTPDGAGRTPDRGQPGAGDRDILGSIVGRRAAAELLKRIPLPDLLQADRAFLMSLPHVGPARADAILALPHLLERMVQTPGGVGVSVSCSRDVFRRFRHMVGLKERELFMVLTLNSRNVITFEEVVAVGSVNTVHVPPADICRQAVRRNAAGIICLHNHPSGDPTPSAEDRALTDRIAGACGLLGIRFLDHLILSAGSYYSFSDAGDL